MTNRLAMALTKFDMFKFTSNRVMEFNMTRTIQGMSENSREFAPEAALVRVDKQKGETVHHRHMCRLLKR